MDPRTNLPYSVEQYVDMHYYYGKNEGNASAAARDFNDKYGTNVAVSTINRLKDRLRETGCVFREKREVGMSEAKAEEMDVVLEAVEANPTVSVRDLARIPGVRSRSSAHRALHDAGLKSYHTTPVQNLEEGDLPQRLILAKWFRKNSNKLNRIIFTDECQFTRETIINSRNFTLWSEFNPYETRPRRFQKQLSVNVWAGILANQLFGPYFLPPRLNSEYYKEFLMNNIDDFVNEEDVPLAERGIPLYFQQDGCPAHSARIVTDYLNVKFPNRWLGRFGPIRWAPRSPDFTPLDFFLWRETKRLVYENRSVVENVDELKERIEIAFDVIRMRTQRPLLRAVASISRRADVCIQQNGGHFEQLL